MNDSAAVPRYADQWNSAFHGPNMFPDENNPAMESGK
jgi:hypothetical protein